jgi:hypothetical protein
MNNNDNKKKNNNIIKERELLKKYEQPRAKKNTFNNKKDMYLEQTDRNYKDGDRN